MATSQRCVFCAILLLQLFVGKCALAVQFEPGVGVGVERSDNASLLPENQVDDLIALTYVGANVFQDEGPLTYQAATGFNKQNYTKDTFVDQTYLYLNALAEWEAIDDRLNFMVSDYFYQRPVLSGNVTTPVNLQDTNIFNIGATISFPVSGRQSFNLLPTYRKYYYEVLTTDNKQYLLTANWQYLATRVMTIGVSVGVRQIDYTETNIFGQSIEDTTFTTSSFTLSGQRVNSAYELNLGITSVERPNEPKASGFSGGFNWAIDVSSRSNFEARASTSLTDTSSVAVIAGGDIGGDEIQVTTDVIRNTLFNVSYARNDVTFNTNISLRYNEVLYETNPLDRVINIAMFQLGYPITSLLSSDVYANFNRDKRLDTNRVDERSMIGATLNYSLSRDLRGEVDLSYRQKTSTLASQNYDEVTIFASLVYGYGNVIRPTRGGGF